jgi:hypothetical protein
VIDPSIAIKEAPDDRGEVRENGLRLVIQFTRIGGITTQTAVGEVKDVYSRIPFVETSGS